MEDALSILPAKKVAAAGPAPSTREPPDPVPVTAAAASCSPLQCISRPVQQPVLGIIDSIFTHRSAQRGVAQSIGCIIAPQTLDLSSEAPLFVVFVWGCIL